jgi:hypothetical protein
MTSPRPTLSPDLIAYMEERERQRLAEANETLAAMTRRERRLVREAAVMGYVRGSMHGQMEGRDAVLPKDSEMVREVIECCRIMSDLYPVMSHLRSAKAARPGSTAVD